MVLALCGSVAEASDILMLKNGDRISGQIITNQNGAGLGFKTHYGAELDIPFAQVLAVQTEQGTMLSYDDIAASPLSDEAPSLIAEIEEDVASVEPAAGFDAEDPSKYKWSGRINLGASLDDGNSQKKALTGDGETKARNEHNRWILGGNVNFANDEGVETENDQTLYGEYNRFLSEKWFVGLRQEFEIDKVALLNLRSKTGPFVGYQFYEEDDLNLKVRGGLNYIYEDYETGNTEEDIAAAFALDYDQTFWDDMFTLFHKHELDLPYDPIDAFLFQSETGLRVPVSKYLTGTAQVDFDWDNDPAAGTREADTKYSLKLGYEW